ncbi:trypsin-like peptidase domain-containing protein [uncultured Alistipes sp.]|uniref:S1C family serine protease n=1 Tax=uncultured Alistipes sp. TaxID=538949 RepID=UPI0026278F8B|nr:trypsin-like peptidase domain-containing protein [uncultured Alistipes sp.]
MKNLLLLISLLLCGFFASAQNAKLEISYPITIDYSSFNYISKQQTWTLTNIILEKDYTAIQIAIRINDRWEGSFSFPKSIYITGDFGTLHPACLYIGEDLWELGKPYNYVRFNKGKGVVCTLLFDRIPAGVSSITYCEPNFITWKNITLPSNPDTEHTDWTQTILKELWAEQGCNAIEGIYQFISTNDKDWWGKYNPVLAVVKTDEGYDLVYIKGANSAVWKEGDLKARFIPTAIMGLYKATTWLMDNKMENENFFIRFSNQTLSIYENNQNITAEFLKLYPANEVPIIEQEDTSPARSNSSRAQQVKCTGSGLILSSNGIVVTNYHVIKSANKIEVSIKDKNTIATYSAKLLCADKTNDLALLIIEDENFKKFEPVPYTISPNIRDVGTSVFTMGYPMANFMGEEVKITDGIISSKTGYEGDIVTYQISAPIQPGNSGGPLFDKKGNLIGITNAGIMAANNVGYAIKVSYLCNLIDSAPISIKIPNTNSISELSLPEQIKCLSKFVAYIKVK